MKKLTLLFLFSIIVIGCEDVIEIELPSTTPTLVIDGNINLFETTNQPIIEGGVRLSFTADYFDTSLPTVENADVRITNLETGEEHRLLHSSNGWYTTEYSDIFSNQDASYELVVKHENKTYRAESKIYGVSPIDSVKQGTRTLFDGDEIEVVISFRDLNDSDNFFLFDLGFNDFIPIRDLFFQGSSFTFSNFYDPDQLRVGDTLNIKSYGISKQYFNYMELLLEQADANGGPFGTAAASLKGNIINETDPSENPLGYFIISKAVSKGLVIQKTDP